MKLQRDWNIDPESLPFSKHIKGKALINLVQKGLRYHHLSVTVDENGQQTKNLLPSMFFFGPDTPGDEGPMVHKEPPLKNTDLTRAASPASTIANAPKKSRDGASVAPDEAAPQPAKRGRKPAQSLLADRNGISARKVSATTEPDTVNGHGPSRPEFASSSVGENAAEDVTLVNGNHEDKMELDNENQTSAEPTDVQMEEPVDDILPPLIPTLTNGESRATQMVPAKVANLAPSSAVLGLETSQTIIKALWRPADVATLVAQGDRFCGVWSLTGQNLHPDSVKPMPQNLFSSPDVGFVTAAAWDANGSLLAVATFSEQEGQIHLFDGQELSLIESLPASQRAVTMLKWSPSAFRLIGVAPVKNDSGDYLPSSTILSWNLAQGPIASAPVSIQLPSTILDVACSHTVRGDEIYAAGESAIYRCTISTDVGVVDQEWMPPNGHNKNGWTFVRCEKYSAANSPIIAAAADTASIWAPDGNLIQQGVHNDAISGLEIRPRRHPSNGAHREMEFATSSLDGTVKIWQLGPTSAGFSCLHILQIGPNSPLMSIAYPMDGFCLAGASYNVVRMWNAENNYNLVASWEGQEPEWRGINIRDDDLASAGGRSSVTGDGLSTIPDHTLSWHNDNKRLAFGLGSQVAIIDFQR